MSVNAARKLLRSYGTRSTDLLSIGVDPKTAKSNAGGEWYTAIQYMAPAWEGGFGNVCTHLSDGCVSACLNTAGNPVYARVKQQARIARKRLYFEQREAYLELLRAEIFRFSERCLRLGRRPCVRLNGTSDIVWERVAPELFKWFTYVQFYDYTKIPKRCLAAWDCPPNYHLTFSRSESNGDSVERVLADHSGRKVAVVFSPWRTKPLPAEWNGQRVIDGDKTDLRFLDRGGRIVGLRAKGRARRDDSGFVVQV